MTWLRKIFFSNRTIRAIFHLIHPPGEPQAFAWHERTKKKMKWKLISAKASLISMPLSALILVVAIYCFFGDRIVINQQKCELFFLDEFFFFFFWRGVSRSSEFEQHTLIVELPICVILYHNSRTVYSRMLKPRYSKSVSWMQLETFQDDTLF